MFIDDDVYEALKNAGFRRIDKSDPDYNTECVDFKNDGGVLVQVCSYRNNIGFDVSYHGYTYDRHTFARYLYNDSQVKFAVRKLVAGAPIFCALARVGVHFVNMYGRYQLRMPGHTLAVIADIDEDESTVTIMGHKYEADCGRSFLIGNFKNDIELLVAHPLLDKGLGFIIANSYSFPRVKNIVSLEFGTYDAQMKLTFINGTVLGIEAQKNDAKDGAYCLDAKLDLGDNLCASFHKDCAVVSDVIEALDKMKKFFN